MEESKVINIKGFDKDGGPCINLFDDGTMQIGFNFMPPLNGADDESTDPIFKRFDKELEKVLGVEVIWEDRESFFIPKPTDTTIDKAKDYLENFWNTHK